MGWFPIDPKLQISYDSAYFDEYAKRSHTDIGKRLTQFRLKFVRRYWTGPVLDFGIGAGAFIEAAATSDYTGFDINPKGVWWLEARGAFDDPWTRGRRVQVITCWDSLEHLEDPAFLVDKIAKWLFVSLPIFRDVAHVLSSKHYKPKEHFWYWTEKGLVQWMGRLGFDLIDKSSGESDIGRQDIGTYAFSRR